MLDFSQIINLGRLCATKVLFMRWISLTRSISRLLEIFGDSSDKFSIDINLQFYMLKGVNLTGFTCVIKTGFTCVNTRPGKCIVIV